jgi:hypothetical protein
MSFAGNLKTVSFSDILQLISTGKKTGRLLATQGSQRKELYFRDGNLIAANSSNTEEDLIGNLLLRMGKINKADLQKAVNFQQQTGRRIGAVMLELGLLTKIELAQYLKIQVEEIVYNLFSWSAGEFSFQDNLQPAEDQILVSLDTINLIMEGTRRIDEWLEIRKSLPEHNRVLKPVLNPYLQSREITLTSDEYQVLMTVDGQKTYSDIMETSVLGDFVTAKAIHTLLNLGLVQTGETAESRQQLHQESERLLFLVAKIYSAAYSSLERTISKKLGNGKNRIFLEAYQSQKSSYPFISGALRDGYNLDQEYLIRQIVQIPSEIRLVRLIQALNSLLFQYLRVVHYALGDNVARRAIADVKKEVALILFEHSELNRKYGLENEVANVFRMVEA